MAERLHHSRREAVMRVRTFRRSLAGLALQGVVGLWLLIEGSQIATLSGLLMMMAGVVFGVTAAGNVMECGDRREHRSEGVVRSAHREGRL